MEIHPITIEAIVDELRQRVRRSTEPVLVDARLAITPEEARLVSVRPVVSLETIRY